MKLQALSRIIGGRKARLVAFWAGRLPFEHLAINLNDWIWLLGQTSGKLQKRVWRQCLEATEKKNAFTAWLLLETGCWGKLPYRWQILCRLLKLARTPEERIYVYDRFDCYRRRFKQNARRQKALNRVKAKFLAALTTFDECVRLYEEKNSYRLSLPNKKWTTFDLPDDLQGPLLTRALALAQELKQCLWVADNCHDFFSRCKFESAKDLGQQALNLALVRAATSAQYRQVFAHSDSSLWPEIREQALDQFQKAAKTVGDLHWLYSSLCQSGKEAQKEAISRCVNSAKTFSDYLYLSGINVLANSSFDDFIASNCLTLADTFKRCCQIIRDSGISHLKDKAYDKALDLATTAKELGLLYDLAHHTSWPKVSKQKVQAKLEAFMD